MTRPANIEPGQRFGELTVVSEVPREARVHRPMVQREWLCRCTCGSETVRATSQLNRAIVTGAAPTCRACLLARQAANRQSNINPGDTFGELTVVSEVPKELRTHIPFALREWFCTCSCGRQAIRTTSQLNDSKKHSQEPCCRVCREELWGGLVEYRRRLKAESNWLRVTWSETGTLYSQLTLEKMEDDIRDGIAAELGFYPDEPALRQQLWADRTDEDLAEPTEHVVMRSLRRSPLKMAKWLRWQTAVDFAMAGWASGLPRHAVEKRLFRFYMRENRIPEDS